MIIEKIKDFLKSDADFNYVPEITETESLVESGVLDSFSVVKLVIFLEKTFSIKVEVTDLVEENIDSLKNIEKFVIKKIKNK